MGKLSPSTRMGVLFATVALATALANAQTTLNVSAGSFLEIEPSAGDTVTFQFTSGPDSGYVFTGTVGQFPVGFYSCVGGCTLSDIKLIAQGGIFSVSPPGSLFGIGGSPVYCWDGGGGFTYSSGFSSQLKAGVLTVKGKVTPDLVFTPADPITCTPNGLPTFVFTGTWQYVAQFVKEQGIPGKYAFTELQIYPVP